MRRAKICHGVRLTRLLRSSVRCWRSKEGGGGRDRGMELSSACAQSSDE